MGEDVAVDDPHPENVRPAEPERDAVALELLEEDAHWDTVTDVEVVTVEETEVQMVELDVKDTD